jgi:hypothetical protein
MRWNPKQSLPIGMQNSGGEKIKERGEECIMILLVS